jgi:hypothetical protein
MEERLKEETKKRIQAEERIEKLEKMVQGILDGK